VLGVIYTPVTKLCFYAAQGLGAFKTHDDGQPTRLQTRKKSGGVVLVAGSRSHRGDSLQAFLEKIGPHEMLSMGSSLKSCLVAEGKVDIYPRLGPTSEWDTAAAQCIVEEAGGELVDMQRKPMRYNTKESLLNPNFLVIGDRDYNWMPYF
jgi:3'(2'), 5'-bisphosphate nucleotidase